MERKGSTKMGEIVDFSHCPKSEILYSGSEKKQGIYYQQQAYMLKFPKRVQGKLSYNHVSEYISSHIMEAAGLDVHHTLLGLYEGQEVVAVKDFAVETGESLIEFSSTGDSSFDTERNRHLVYSYEEITYLLEQHAKILDKEKLIQRFWRMFVVDALTANFDRHGYNWGFLKGSGGNRLAPVYDNGSSLFPRLQEQDLDRVLNSEEEMKKRTYQFPTSQILLNGRKSSYYEVIASGQFPACKEAENWLMSSLDFGKIDSLIDTTVFISEKRKRFYKEILRYRYKHIFAGGEAHVKAGL